MYIYVFSLKFDPCLWISEQNFRIVNSDHFPIPMDSNLTVFISFLRKKNPIVSKSENFRIVPTEPIRIKKWCERKFSNSSDRTYPNKKMVWTDGNYSYQLNLLFVPVEPTISLYISIALKRVLHARYYFTCERARCPTPAHLNYGYVFHF